jgi:hypothetical protein
MGNGNTYPLELECFLALSRAEQRELSNDREYKEVYLRFAPNLKVVYDHPSDQ